MATISEKLDHFRKMFGGEAAQILDTASQVEKEADELKVEYKETDTETPAPVTEKAPAEKVEIEVEVEPEEEETEAEDEAEEVEEDEKDFDPTLEAALGLMDVKEYGALMADVLEAGVLAPIQEQISTMKESIIDELRQSFAVYKERQDEGMALAADAAVDHEDRLSVVEKLLAETTKALKEANARLKELQGDMPRGYSRGYRASDAEDTIIPDGDPRLKEGPSADPLATFADQFVLNGLKS